MNRCRSCTVLERVAVMVSLGWEIQTKRTADGQFCVAARHDSLAMMERVVAHLTPQLTVESCGPRLDDALLGVAYKTRSTTH